jgi:NitT/TauT family transport system substrate-binding protein
MPFGQVRRGLCVAAAGLSVVVAGSACGSGAASAPSAGSITVGALPIADSVGLYLAEEAGFFRQNGLNVTITQVPQNANAIPLMQSGKIDIIAGANYISYFQLDTRSPGSPPFTLLAEGTTCATSAFEVLTLPDSKISTPGGLARETIAVNTPDNVQTLTINTLLAADGVNTAQVHYEVIPFGNMLAALQAHKVAAISAVEPFITAAELRLGAVPILDECTGPTANFPLSGYFATSAWAKEHPAQVAAFQRALTEGQALAAANRADVEQALLTYIPHLTAQEASLLTLNGFPTQVNPAQLQTVANLMALGGLSRSFNVSSILSH